MFYKGNISRVRESRPLNPTRCTHTISQEDRSSVLSLTASKRYLFSGSQDSNIHGHRGSVLGLCLSPDEQWLFSCSGDGTVRVWSTESLMCAYLIQSCHDVGDIFSVVFSEQSHTIFFGSQNTSIQWYDFGDPQTHGMTGDLPSIPALSDHQKSKFFESPSCLEDLERFPGEEDVIQCIIREKNVCMNAHDGYVYCLLHVSDIPNTEGEVLISGSGDGDVKIWAFEDGRLRLLNVLHGDSDKGVLSLALSEDGYLFCGVQGGDIRNQLIRSVMAHSDDVLSVTIKGPGLISASADGTIKLWGEGFEYRECLDDHDGIVLSMTYTNGSIVTGSSDHTIKFWDMPYTNSEPEVSRRSSIVHDAPSSVIPDIMMYVLDKWIAMRTISGLPNYMEECRRGARFLKNVLQQLGAVSRMIPGATGRNPLVYGRFSAKRRSTAGTPAKKTPTILVYGHYDVIAADESNEQWKTDPFKLVGMNGYLYGRGTSDNKGPILSCIFAVYELLKEGLLDANVIFLVEGEEESGSVGFNEAVTKNSELFQGVDMILLSNSYWLGEDVPCLTYGLRGVIHAKITISNTLADMHSGVEGGAVSEPLIDLIHVTGQLVGNDKKVLIPGFYDKVRAVTAEEERLYDPIVEWLQTSEKALSSTRTQHSAITSPTLSNQSRQSSEHERDGREIAVAEELKQQLMARWRYPTLSVHKIDVSINNPTIIPRAASAVVSMRVVPDQCIEDISHRFKTYVRNVFDRIGSDNDISIHIQSSAEYWLGNPRSQYFKTVEKAIEKEWNMKPLYIREGGSIPAVRFLEKFCDAPAVHLPMGQASDQAHLHNERICLRNLHAGRRIVRSLLQDLASEKLE
ncbi:hypothetical protein BCR43DRAFT_444964 [Syncephalastrum racemosum]|uniref:Peptidase M20 dimerisation domain-containing protein n=1 Tax=Syncephalastrum racemosum TaxID=13706 RepID=A0A1X2H526_SYNRA|nr:hypothetical protein BCR43DRAFT_444964 [Syncephalastrum racemosum]